MDSKHCFFRIRTKRVGWLLGATMGMLLRTNSRQPDNTWSVNANNVDDNSQDPQVLEASLAITATAEMATLSGSAVADQPFFTPVQVFLPPMYSAPLGPVNLPDTSDEGLLHYFMTVASKTWSALDSFGMSS